MCIASLAIAVLIEAICSFWLRRNLFPSLLRSFTLGVEKVFVAVIAALYLNEQYFLILSLAWKSSFFITIVYIIFMAMIRQEARLFVAVLFSLLSIPLTGLSWSISSIKLLFW